MGYCFRWNLSKVSVEFGASWTTDAPFRETATLINFYSSKGVLAVEMEAAALYAFQTFLLKRKV